jgi:ribose 1,5-bisphosphokinase
MGGRLIAVVGPSGAGKDTLIAAMCGARPGLACARRVITRSAKAGGEEFEGVSSDEFAARAAAGAFALSWQAHGLSYGISHAALAPLEAGGDLLVNLSRGVLDRACGRFGDAFFVLHVTAPTAERMRRLTGRGREDTEAIADRVARAVPSLPAQLRVAEIDNGGALEHAVAQAFATLDGVWQRERSR